MNFQITGINVLVRLEDAESKTQGGIIMPDCAKDSVSLAKGKVIGKGPGFLFPKEADDLYGATEVKIKHIPLDVSIGDTVYFPKDHGESVLLHGQQFLILSYPSIRLFEKAPLPTIDEMLAG